ncbi:hypothetical protein OAF98_02115 [Planctomicrobium sp.]|jgi:hypothetical protein|nr:hypothetical protein [Planctomicrobium sp.]MDA7527459.1 hypothetical protein [bacterium]MDB4439815.1 hypothetical protein [Planctomicrobium sp.]MDB4731686.1 hypothetical protein [bacterium]MDB4733384.1 hypothetical protein [Planctomicrobium sp.]MDB4743257.1 hypothetical protein [Planctomicrobium sp.]
MADLTNLSSLSGNELSPTQIQGVIEQIDLDITNLVREGKLSALKYSITGGAGQSTDRAANLNALLHAREYYQKLLNAAPSWNVSQATTQ